MNNDTRTLIDDPISQGTIVDANGLNADLMRIFLSIRERPEVRRSHFFGGRYENLYPPLSLIPPVETVLEEVLEEAAPRVGHPVNELRAGFWLNFMLPGESTTRHSHDEDDELLAAVYYVAAPPDSGDLVLHLPKGDRVIAPEAGRFVLFPPTLPHSVSENRSDSPRLSIGINIGPA